MAAELVAEEGVLKGLVLVLEHGEEWVIGRDPESSTIVIEDAQVSRRHVRIWKTDEGYCAENLSETNPVLVDTVPLESAQLLHDKELLTIGSTRFRFYAEGMPYLYGYEIETKEESELENVWKNERPAEEQKEEDEDEIEIEPEELPKETPSEKEGMEEKEEEAILEEEEEEEELFEEPESAAIHIDLTTTTRFILKVIAGPNTGAEFALELDRTYLIGTDVATCDIVFNDLSISREHAQLKISRQGDMVIEDNNSRNGVIVDKERITESALLGPNSVVQLGTSAFLIIDREAPAQTIAAQFEEPKEEEEKAPEEEKELVAAPAAAIVVKAPFPAAALMLTLMICSLAVLFGIGIVSLLQTKEIIPPHRDFKGEITQVIKEFPAVRFTYNQPCNQLFLLGHVKTGIEHNELLYQLKGLGFVSGIDDNIVNDEAVWQEMNILLSKHPDFKGVSMHSPQAGQFVINGYLQTETQAAHLTDYLNLNFNYLSRLENRVVVEESVTEEAAAMLIQQGFGSVNAAISNGELILTGYISESDLHTYDSVVEQLKKIPGIRGLRNFVVPITPERRVIDLNKKYQNQVYPKQLRYQVTGYSKHGDVNVNVVINGRIVGRGDCVDGYTITSIQPYTVFMEKDGLKYKIEYNKCNTFGPEE